MGHCHCLCHPCSCREFSPPRPRRATLCPELGGHSAMAQCPHRAPTSPVPGHRDPPGHNSQPHPSGRAMGTGSLTLQDDSDGVGPEPFSPRAQGLVLSCGERHRGAPSGGVGGARTPLPPHFTSALPCMEQQILNSAPPVWIEDPSGSAPAPLPPFPPRAHPKLFPLTGVGWRAELAGIAPGTAQGAAAGGPGDPHADLSAAGDAPIPSVLRVQEAIPDPGICTGTGLVSKASPGKLVGAGGRKSWNSGMV